MIITEEKISLVATTDTRCLFQNKKIDPKAKSLITKILNYPNLDLKIDSTSGNFPSNELLQKISTFLGFLNFKVLNVFFKLFAFFL